MGEKKEYLNEEWYQNVKKKITRISLIILIISVLIGGSLIAAGIIKTDSSKKEAIKINEKRYNEAYKESKEKFDAANKRLSEIATEKETLKKQYNSKELECDSLNMRDQDWYAKVNQCDREASDIKSKISELELEERELKSYDFTVYYDIAVAKNYNFMSVIGGVVIFIGGMIALIVYVIAKKREITAFGVQQMMPIAQEGIETIVPTVAKTGKEVIKEMAPAYGEVAKEISNGIKEGLKDEE